MPDMPDPSQESEVLPRVPASPTAPLPDERPPWFAKVEAELASFDLEAALADEDRLVGGISAANSYLAEWAIDLVNDRDIRNVLAALRHLGVSLTGDSALLPVGECWFCGALTSSLYSGLVIDPGAPAEPSWCEECQVLGETGTLQEVKDRLLERVKVLMRERLSA